MAALAFFRRAFLRHQPTGHARMRHAEGGKFYRIHQPITDQLIHEHLAGRLTLGCQFQRNGRGYCAAVDLDSGGMAALVELLARCKARGLWAFAIRVDSGDHDGGHLFIPFEREQDAAALQQLAGQISGAREVYPSGGDLRLPFGLHQRARTRGALLLQDGTCHDLDADPGGGLALLESRWRANPGCLRKIPRTARGKTPSRSPGKTPSRDLVGAILDQFGLEDRLEHYGARKGPGRLYYCPFHDDREASLQLYIDQQGYTVCHCHSKLSACPLAEHRRNDVINIVAIGEQISIGEATRRLAEELRAARPAPASSTSRPARPAGQLDQDPPPARPAPVRTQARSAPHTPSPVLDTSAAERRRAALLRVMSDPSLPPCARATYKALDEAAGDRGFCATPVATLAFRSQQDKRSVQRGLRLLESSYVTTLQRYGQTSRYTLFWLSERTNEQGVIERSPNMLDHEIHACEGVIGHESHDRAGANFSQTEPASAVEPPGAVELAGMVLQDLIASAGDAIADAGPNLVEPPGAGAQLDQAGESRFFWTPERLASFGRMRAGPPRPRPGQRQRREKQARFTTLAGELPKRLAGAPPGPLPAAAPLIIPPVEVEQPSASPATLPSNTRTGSRKRRAVPPSQASSGVNPWRLPDDDPWLVQQRRALEAAQRRGDFERVKFYRWVLEGVE